MNCLKTVNSGTSLFIAALFVMFGHFTGDVYCQNYTWSNVKMGGGGFVTGFIAHPTQQNLIYTRTDVGGAYRWEETTESWTPLNDWVSESQVGLLGIESFALDPNAPEMIYMLAGIDYFNGGKTAILRSSDYGSSFSVIEVTSQFKAHGNGAERHTGEKLVVDPNNSNILFCGTRSNGLFRSCDKGDTWSRVSSLDITTTPNKNGICFVVFDPQSAVSDNTTQTIYVAVARTGDNLYRSTDGGSSWTVVSGGPTNSIPQRCAFASDGGLFISFASGENGGLWRYDTQNGIWEDKSPVENRTISGISIDPEDPNRIVASTYGVWLYQPNGAWGDRVFTSIDGGDSWVDLMDSERFSFDNNGFAWIEGHSLHWAGCVMMDPFNSNRAFIISGNGIFCTENLFGNESVWKFMVNGLEETVPLDMVSVPGGRLLSGLGDIDGFTHTDVGVSPESGINEPGMANCNSVAFAAKNPNILARVGRDLYFSDNSGENWTKSVSKPVTDANQGTVAISSDGSVLLWNYGSSTYRTTDRGAYWTQCSGLSFGSRLAADPENSNKFYSYNRTSGYMYVSTDGGQSFTQAGSAGTSNVSRIAVVLGYEGHLWVPLGTGGLSRSTNSGETFTQVENVTHCGAVGLGKAAPGKAYPALYIWGSVGDGVRGIYRSIDEGATWERVNDDEHEFGGPGNGHFVMGDPDVYGRVYMSTAGRGIVYGEPSQTVPCTPTEIVPYLQVNEGEWVNSNEVTANPGDMIVLGPQPLTGGSWSWSGPENFSSTDKEITFSSLEAGQAGEYAVTYTNSEGCQSTIVFNLRIEPSVSSLASGKSTKPRLIFRKNEVVLNGREGEYYSIRLFTVKGVLLVKERTSGSAVITLPHTLAKGSYLLRVESSAENVLNYRMVCD